MSGSIRTTSGTRGIFAEADGHEIPVSGFAWRAIFALKALCFSVHSICVGVSATFMVPPVDETFKSLAGSTNPPPFPQSPDQQLQPRGLSDD
jgi:hypothetical protein